MIQNERKLTNVFIHHDLGEVSIVRHNLQKKNYFEEQRAKMFYYNSLLYNHVLIMYHVYAA